MNRLAVLAKVVAGVSLMAMVLAPARPADAYRACSSSQTAYCSQFGGPMVVCSTAHYCFSNMCFAQCAGFSSSNCTETTDCLL
jgi:hypothetical protein